MDGDPGSTTEPHDETAAPPASDGAGAPTVRPVTLLLIAVALLSLPGGVILLYLAATRGEPSPRPAAGRGVVGVDATVPSTDLDGRWSLLSGGASELRYSVDATSRGGARITVTGSTPAVEAGLVIAGGRVETVAAQADLRQVSSAAPVPAREIGTTWIETDRHPLVRFRSAAAVGLPATLTPGTAVPLVVDGELTFHGVTRPARLTLTATVSDQDQLVLVLEGTAPIMLADFGVGPPSLAEVETMEERAELKLRLQLARRTTTVTIARDITGGTAGTTPTGPGTAPAP